MSRNAPTVMISSTYYDLRQVRQDLVKFIKNDLGYNALASEFDSFPVDPDADTIENCRRRVEKEADILVLIIGGRYGYVDKKSNKSVTNLEYLAARAKGIPVYAFVDKGILPLLPVWENRPKAKFTPIVSDNKVFEFIKQVRTTDSVWTFEFEHAQDIVKALQLQFGHLMNEGLKAIRRLSSNKNRIPSNISGKALRFALEESDYWEFYLFAQVLVDEIDKHSHLREEYNLKTNFTMGDRISLTDSKNWWLKDRTNELKRFSEAVYILLNDRLKAAVGEPGSPGNAKAIVEVAKQLGNTYKEIISWSLKVRAFHVHICLQAVLIELSSIFDDSIIKIENYGPNIFHQLGEVAFVSSNETELDLRLSFDIKNIDQYINEVERAIKDCEGASEY